MRAITASTIVIVLASLILASFMASGGAAAQTGCVQSLASSTTHGSWTDDCAAQNRPGSYARYFTFSLSEQADVTITLESATDPYLFLLDDSDAFVAENDDIDYDARNLNSRIIANLAAGSYTIEATTYSAGATGDFTLVVDIDGVVEPPPPDVAYIAISSGANHVCAIATDGSIMCWGNDRGDSHGQISDRPREGRFTAISSGDTHTCALRDDGAVICWGSIDVP